MRKAILSPSMP